MKSSDQYNTKQNFSLLLVGEPNSGKTNIIMSFPDPYILDVDRKLGSAVRRAKGKKFWFSDPYVDDAGKELVEADRWKRAVTELKAAAANPDIKTLVIDGLAGLADMLVVHIMAEVRKSEGKALDRLRIQDYQPLKTLLTSLIMGLRSTNKYIVVTSHQKADKDELTGRLRYTLNIPGSLSENFGGFFSDVWASVSRPGTNGTVYELHTKPTGFHVNLGTSLALDAKPIDVTNKSPDDVWKLLNTSIT